MPDIQKITVLLADGDSLRQDGVAAILNANPEIKVVAGCSDGLTALEQIRRLRPDVAVVDLNLPDVHGIELVRRVRGEVPGVKVIILSGTMDDDIVREVVRAGADGYLLKNCPARHLVDAIRYVHDGGQYFSPQLGRDGRARHLLEEPPRLPRNHAFRDEEESAAHHGEPARSGERSRPRAADPGRFRERIREEAPRDLRDRDYEIMSQMADGIRPILDRLDEIEGRVSEMEEGGEPLPEDPRGWLHSEIAETLKDPRSGLRKDKGDLRTSRDLEARLPQLIEAAVSKRFQSMAGQLQEEIEEQHVRTLETFVKNIQVRLVQRVSTLEQNMSRQVQAMHELREYNQRTEDNLSRLISGVDKLAHELPKRLASAPAADSTESPAPGVKSGSAADNAREKRSRRYADLPSKKNSGPKIFRAGVAVFALCVGGYEIYSKVSGGDSLKVAVAGKDAAAASLPKSAPLAAGSDTKTKLEAAKQYMDRKEYATAEDIYKQIVQAEPNNQEALKDLASVLYREDKLEESEAIIGRLPPKN